LLYPLSYEGDGALGYLPAVTNQQGANSGAHMDDTGLRPGAIVGPLPNCRRRLPTVPNALARTGMTRKGSGSLLSRCYTT